MIKWKKKSCVERKKQYTSIEGQGRVEQKKECARMEELMFVDRKKIKLRLLEDNHERTYIIQFFMFPERILP